MILFRLISFGLRVFFSFLFVFILQVKWDGKTLENYLIHFSQSFFVTEILNQTGKDGVKVMRHISGSKNRMDFKQKSAKEIPSIVQSLILNTEKRLKLPNPTKK